MVWREGRLYREGIFVYIVLIHSVAQQKLTPHCKAGPLGTPLGLVHWKRASSPVEAGTAGYL